MRAPAFSRLLLLTGVLLALAGVAYAQAPFVIGAGPLSDGAVSRGYFSFISTTGASTGAITWSVLSGNFPPGLVLDPGSPPNTFISGTPTQAGTFTFIIQAVDSQGRTATQQFSITVNTRMVISTPPTLHAATANANYQTNLSAVGGVPPYFWSLTNDGSSTGALPPGMVLRDNGLITGISPTPGVYTFLAYINDNSSTAGQFDSRTFSITVNPPVTITSPSLPGGVVGIRYDARLTVKDGNAPYQWAIAAGSLPPGLALGADGSVEGIPTLAGTYNFRATVTDLFGSTASGSFVISIAGQLAITTAPPLPVGAVGAPYTVTFVATTASAPVTWSTLQGALPPGLALDPATGILAGTPTTAGNFSFTIRAEDTSEATASRAFTIAITEPLVITTATLPDGTVGVQYSKAVEATGGTKPYAFSITGNLPAGLTFDPSTGVITGKPTQAGASTFIVQVTDATQKTASKELSINIIAALAFTTESPLPGATGGSAYSQSITVTGGTQPYAFKIDSGAAPAGVTLDAAGALSGTPTALGDFHFVVRVTDASQSTLTKAYDLTVAAPTVPPPTIGGVNDTEPPAQQPALSLELEHSYPLPLNGTMTLTFQSAVGDVDDPAVQFSTGGRTVDFTIPQGSTTAVFSDADLLLSTGTVAGTITLTLQFQASGQDVTPQPAPTQVIQIPAQAPVISTVTATRNSTGFQVVVTGFSNTREMVSSAFQFQAVSGTTLQTDHAEPAVDQIFATWYGDANSQQFGSQFTFTQPFTVTGNVNGVAGVTVSLTNAQGKSNVVTATVQ